MNECAHVVKSKCANVMQAIKKTKNLGIRATEEKRTELKQLALNRKTTVQGLFECAMESYLSGGSTNGGNGNSTTATKPSKNISPLGISPIPVPKGLSDNSMKDYVECATNLVRLFETKNILKIQGLMGVINNLFVIVKEAPIEDSNRRHKT